MAANAVADAARPESVIGHLIPANGILLQFEEMVHQVFFEREKHLAQEKLHSVTKEARAADQAENAALQRHLHQTMEQLKHSKAGHLGCKLQLEEAHVEIDSLKARLRVASRELEDAKAEAIEEKGRSAAEATRATEASDATWDALWATESAKCEAKMKEMDQAHATDIRTVREQAEEKLLTFSVNRCATVSATVSEAMLKQRLSEAKEKNERVQGENQSLRDAATRTTKVNEDNISTMQTKFAGEISGLRRQIAGLQSQNGASPQQRQEQQKTPQTVRKALLEESSEDSSDFDAWNDSNKQERKKARTADKKKAVAGSKGGAASGKAGGGAAKRGGGGGAGRGRGGGAGGGKGRGGYGGGGGGAELSFSKPGDPFSYI